MTNDFMEFENYKNELELINNLNPYEEEMYLVLGHVIRACITEENLTLRNVSNDKGKGSLICRENFKANRMTDFVILSEDYNPFKEVNREKPAQDGIYGTVEIKMIGTNLDKMIEDIEGYLPYFKKVIYTDGLEWRFYGWDVDGNAAEIEYEENGKQNPKCAKRIILGEERNEMVMDEKTGIKKYKIDWKDVSAWEELLQYLKSLKWQQ